MATYGIVMSFEGIYDLFLGQNEPVVLTVDGLVSDNAIIDLAGHTLFAITSSPALLESFRNIHPTADGTMLEIETRNASISLRVHLKAIWELGIDVSGRLTAMRNLYLREQSMDMQSFPAAMTLVVLAMMSDWSDAFMSDLVDMPLQDMIYTEVE